VRIFLQNRGLGFSLEPGHPAEYGPGRRPPHTLSPALVTEPDGSLHAVVGTMGGDSQPQILLQLLVRLLALAQSPADAIAAPRWDLNGVAGRGFDTWTDPDGVVVRVEEHAPEAWIDGLRARGHEVTQLRAFDHAVGHAHVILNGDALAGAADPRARVGAAAAY
jgi:gamma-glutamyltranspeptidase/glutathione hydrolase